MVSKRGRIYIYSFVFYPIRFCAINIVPISSSLVFLVYIISAPNLLLTNNGIQDKFSNISMGLNLFTYSTRNQMKLTPWSPLALKLYASVSYQTFKHLILQLYLLLHFYLFHTVITSKPHKTVSISINSSLETTGLILKYEKYNEWSHITKTTEEKLLPQTVCVFLNRVNIIGLITYQIKILTSESISEGSNGRTKFQAI